MTVFFNRSFNNDIAGINNKNITDVLKIIIQKFEDAKEISEIPNIKKIKGYKFYFRKRIGNYRLGFKLENNKVTFIRFKHRKDIYKKFP